MVTSPTEGQTVVDLDPGVIEALTDGVKEILLLAAENPQVTTLVVGVLVGAFIILLVKAWRKPGQQ